MAEFKETDTSGCELGTGVLVPMLSHRWRIEFNGCSRDYANVLSSQTTKAKINLVKRELYIEIEQTSHPACSKTLMNAVKWLTQRSPIRFLDIQSLDGCDNCLFVLRMSVVATDHNLSFDYSDLSFDYSNSGVIVHKMSFEISEIETDLADTSPKLNLKSPGVPVTMCD